MTLANVAKLLALEAIGIVVLRYMCIYIAGFDPLDFRSPRGRMIGIALTIFVFASLYNVMASGEFIEIGARSLYSADDQRRRDATRRLSLRYT